MNLETILKQIRALPWKMWDTSNTVNGQRLEEQYKIHAANVLPELVAAAREFQYAMFKDGKVPLKTCDRLTMALTAAEEIK